MSKYNICESSESEKPKENGWKYKCFRCKDGIISHINQCKSPNCSLETSKWLDYRGTRPYDDNCG